MSLSNSTAMASSSLSSGSGSSAWLIALLSQSADPQTISDLAQSGLQFRPASQRLS